MRILIKHTKAGFAEKGHILTTEVHFQACKKGFGRVRGRLEAAAKSRFENNLFCSARMARNAGSLAKRFKGAHSMKRILLEEMQSIEKGRRDSLTELSRLAEETAKLSPSFVEQVRRGHSSIGSARRSRQEVLESPWFCHNHKKGCGYAQFKHDA